MAEVTLSLRHDAKTGRRQLVIHFESEEDALPHEHEQDHRAFVEALLGVPVDDLADEIVVERKEESQRIRGREEAHVPQAEKAREG